MFRTFSFISNISSSIFRCHSKFVKNSRIIYYIEERLSVYFFFLFFLYQQFITRRAKADRGIKCVLIYEIIQLDYK